MSRSKEDMLLLLLVGVVCGWGSRGLEVEERERKKGKGDSLTSTRTTSEKKKKKKRKRGNKKKMGFAEVGKPIARCHVTKRALFLFLLRDEQKTMGRQEPKILCFSRPERKFLGDGLCISHRNFPLITLRIPFPLTRI